MTNCHLELAEVTRKTFHYFLQPTLEVSAVSLLRSSSLLTVFDTVNETGKFLSDKAGCNILGLQLEFDRDLDFSEGVERIEFRIQWN